MAYKTLKNGCRDKNLKQGRVGYPLSDPYPPSYSSITHDWITTLPPSLYNSTKESCLLFYLDSADIRYILQCPFPMINTYTTPTQLDSHMTVYERLY